MMSLSHLNGLTWYTDLTVTLSPPAKKTFAVHHLSRNLAVYMYGRHVTISRVSNCRVL